MLNNYDWIIPEWPAPPQVKALTTTKEGGYSREPYQSFNLSLGVGDEPETVLANRALLREKANLPNEPYWLQQVHGTKAVELGVEAPISLEADAAFTRYPQQICVVTTADCLPILVCNKSGTVVAAIHAGWKGLAAGVIAETVKKLACDPSTLLVWLGPAIGPTAFEVREEVLTAFKAYPSATAFTATPNGTWFADLYQLAKEQLQRLGVTDIFGGHFCTYREPQRFFSFRRSKTTGRMATLIWLTPS